MKTTTPRKAVKAPKTAKKTSKVAKVTKASDALPDVIKGPIIVADPLKDDAASLEEQLRTLCPKVPIKTLSSFTELTTYLSKVGSARNQGKVPFPRAIFLNVRLGAKDSLKLIKSMRKRPVFEKLLIVVLSPDTDVYAVRDAYQSGANTFLAKPFVPQDLKNLKKSFHQHLA